MKRFICLITVVVMLVVAIPTIGFAKGAGTQPFSDVKSTDYYADSASMLSQLDIMTGYPDGTFGASKSVTRAEMAALVCRMMGEGLYVDGAYYKDVFDDVESSHWASGYINFASDMGVINGDGNGKFRPEDNVKYEEAIKMIFCAYGYIVENEPGDWSAGYIRLAQELGIADSVRSTKGRTSTRGDVAVMIHKTLISELYPPEASLIGGDYEGEQELFLDASTDDVEIYYTLDGEEPTTNSQKYRGSITLTESCVIKAIAVKDDILISEVMTEYYEIYEETYNLIIEDVNHGTIIASEGQYAKGERIYLEAIPDVGYEFDGWNCVGGGRFKDENDSETYFTMPDDDVVISAYFVRGEETNEQPPVKDDKGDEPSGGNNPVRVTYYTGSVVPKYESITGSPQVVTPLSHEQSDAVFIQYFYDSNEEEKNAYIEFLEKTGWELTGTSTAADSRGKCEVIGFAHYDSEGNKDAMVQINFFPDCGDVDLTCVLKNR